jgi:PleD family two-component response regulator
VSLRPKQGEDLHAAIEAADAQLYASKEGGRHRANYADETSAPTTVTA